MKVLSSKKKFQKFNENNAATQSMALNTWQFLTTTFDGINSRIYINGTLVKNDVLSSSFSMPMITRTNCFIGKSSWAADGVSFSYIDSLRFYNISLTQSQIIELMNQIDTGNVLKIFQIEDLDPMFYFN